MNNLKKLRKDNNLTQKDVAAALNIARTTYVGYELGNRDIPTDILISLAKFYDVSFEYLLGSNDYMNISYSSLIELLMANHNDKLGKFLQSERKKRNMSIKDFSDFLGISQSYLNILENNSNSKESISPTIHILNSISKSLDISLNDLLNVCGYSDNNTTSENTSNNNQPVNTDYSAKNLFSERLRELRKNKNLSQKDLGDIIGVAANSISQYESGVREPSVEILNKLADLFNVSIDYLLCRNENDISVPIVKDNIPNYFETPQDAVKFILEQPMIANFGGYNLDLMSDEEIMDMAEDVADMLRIMAKKHKK